MIEYRPLQRYYLLRCDRCNRQDTVKTATTEAGVRVVAARWGWVLKAEQGDLCPRCATRQALADSGQEAGKRATWRPVWDDSREAKPLADRVWEKGTLGYVLFSEEENGAEGMAGRPACERCGRPLPWTAVPHERGVYLCDDCADDVKDDRLSRTKEA